MKRKRIVGKKRKRNKTDLENTPRPNNKVVILKYTPTSEKTQRAMARFFSPKSRGKIRYASKGNGVIDVNGTPDIDREGPYKDCAKTDLKLDFMLSSRAFNKRMLKKFRVAADKPLVNNVEEFCDELINEQEATITLDDINSTKPKHRSSAKRIFQMSAKESLQGHNIKITAAQLLHLIAWMFLGKKSMNKLNFVPGGRSANITMRTFEYHIRDLTKKAESGKVKLKVRTFAPKPSGPAKVISYNYGFNFICDGRDSGIFFEVRTKLPLLKDIVDGGDKMTRNLIKAILNVFPKRYVRRMSANIELGSRSYQESSKNKSKKILPPPQTNCNINNPGEDSDGDEENSPINTCRRLSFGSGYGD